VLAVPRKGGNKKNTGCNRRIRTYGSNVKKRRCL